MEGVFVPLMDPDIDQQAALKTYFTGPKWRGHCYNGIDEETADVVDGILATSSLTRQLRVNRAKLAESDEAWIHVMISPAEGREEYRLFDGFPSGRGIITWENSD